MNVMKIFTIPSILKLPHWGFRYRIYQTHTHIKLLDFSAINGQGQYVYIHAYNFHIEIIPKFVLIIAITWIAWSVPDRIVYILCSNRLEFSEKYDHCLV